MLHATYNILNTNAKNKFLGKQYKWKQMYVLQFDHLKFGILILTFEIVLAFNVKIIRISYVKQTVQNIWKRF